MKRRYKALGAVSILAIFTVSTFAMFLRHDAPCAAAPALPADAQSVKAAVYRCYGSPDVVKIEDVAKPIPTDDQILIKVRAASVNPLDWHYMRGSPYIARMMLGFGKPKNMRLGVDAAGQIEAVGRNVTRFKPGDEVFGKGYGAFAEYALTSESEIALKPANLTFEQAAALPVAALAALQGLRDKGRIQPGQKVLINGASGCVGTFAVQIAKSFGAEVTGVCSTKNVEMVRSIGADHVIDYTKEDFTQGARQYDIVLDNVGNHSLSDLRRVMTAKGIYVMNGGGGPDDSGSTGPVARAIKVLISAPFVSQEVGSFMTSINARDLAVLKELTETRKVTPVIERSYRLSEIGAAIRHVEQGHARGKIVISME